MIKNALFYVFLIWKYRKNIRVGLSFWKKNCFQSIQFEDIVIAPTKKMIDDDLKKISGGVTFIGGPIWPMSHPFVVRTLRRHGIFYVISDVIDDNHDLLNGKDSIESVIEAAVWCGPVFNHFGHMIVDFMGRVAVSAELNPNVPLLFSIPDGVEAKKYVPIFFWDIVQILGAKKENIRFINVRTRVKKLLIYPQAECLGGGVPSAKYLSLLDSLSKKEEKIYEYVYFSRGAFYSGGVAGERYFEKVMAEAGVLVIRPEEHAVEIQFKLCKQAKVLIITEGSAVHLLQLFGHDAVENLIILSRRKSNWSGNKFCINLIRLRTKAIKYINVISYMFAISDGSMAMAILNKDLFLLKMKDLGINLTPFWDDEDYENSRSNCKSLKILVS